MIPVAGVLADGMVGNHHRGGCLLFGAGGFLIAFTTDFRVVLLLPVMECVGFGCINPVVVTLIGDMYTGDREAKTQRLQFIVSNVGGTSFQWSENCSSSPAGSTCFRLRDRRPGRDRDVP